MDQDNDEIMEVTDRARRIAANGARLSATDEEIREARLSTTAAVNMQPPTRVQVDVYQYSGGSCIMSWHDVMLNQPPVVGGALNFMYADRWYMIAGTYRVVMEEIRLDS